MTLKTQAKVLRVLQEQRVEPVGGTATVTVDVRVIAATNKNLEEEIRQRHVPRGPLLPPERDPLPRAAAARAARGRAAPGPPLHGRDLRRVRPAAQGARAGGPRRCCARSRGRATCASCGTSIERLVIMTPGDRIEARHLPAPLLSAAPAPRRPPAAAPAPCADFASLAEAREDFEKRYIWRKYQECGGNMSRTAEALQVERSNLYRKMKGYGLLPTRKGDRSKPKPDRTTPQTQRPQRTQSTRTEALPLMPLRCSDLGSVVPCVYSDSRILRSSTWAGSKPRGAGSGRRRRSGPPRARGPRSRCRPRAPRSARPPTRTVSNTRMQRRALEVGHVDRDLGELALPPASRPSP